MISPRKENGKESSAPFYSIGESYKLRFGSRTQILPVSVSSTCPNRLGLKGMQTCVFCDEWGSAAYKDAWMKPLQTQIEEKMRSLGHKYNVKNFLVYFQSYTNSFHAIPTLRAHYDTALSFPKVRGIVVGTRPDCLSNALCDLWTEYAQKTYVSVELGVQTLDDSQLQFLRRGHSASDSLRAIEKLGTIPGIEIGIHLIFGVPGETEEQLIQTAKTLSALPIHNVKLHNLHVLKGTPLEHIHARGEFEPLSLEEYSERVRVFLEHLSPRIAVQRLSALSATWEELIAPVWNREKLRTRNAILKHIEAKRSFQGKHYLGPEASEGKIHVGCIQ